MAEEHFKEGSVTHDPAELKKMIERDEDVITNRLETILGKGRRQNFGQGSAKRKVMRWDWNDHSFLLSVVDGEFVSLSIEKSELADKRGKQTKIADMHIRRVHEANVENRNNGDVVIMNIPMVDQGPKGYCVPATFERCMRYMKIPADMYLLAMAGNTGMGGGTVISTLVKAVQHEVWAAGRTLKTVEGFPSFKELENTLRMECPSSGGCILPNGSMIRPIAELLCDAPLHQICGGRLLRQLMIRSRACHVRTGVRIYTSVLFTDIIRLLAKLHSPIRGGPALQRDGYQQKRQNIFPAVAVGSLNIKKNKNFTLKYYVTSNSRNYANPRSFSIVGSSSIRRLGSHFDRQI